MPYACVNALLTSALRQRAAARAAPRSLPRRRRRRAPRAAACSAHQVSQQSGIWPSGGIYSASMQSENILGWLMWRNVAQRNVMALMQPFNENSINTTAAINVINGECLSVMW